MVHLENDGEAIKKFPNSNLRNKSYYRNDGLTWSTVTSGSFSIREFGYGFYFDNGGSCLFIENKGYFMALLNSKIFSMIQKISPTLNFQPGDIGRVPVIVDEQMSEQILTLVRENVEISKKDWNSFETSWDFAKHPLIEQKEDSSSIELPYKQWEVESKKRFNRLKENEETINQIFIEIYGLQHEVTPEVDDKDVTIRIADLNRDIKSFISYAIGCSFGRYSLDEEGLIYAGGEFNSSRYRTFLADEDNILPALSGAYFNDDIVTRFIDFVQVIFGEETLEENLDFVADAIGRKRDETAREALRRYFLNDFYKDHVQTYKKRPIYWLFTSGKEKAFNCLIYMHRYDKTTLSRIRTDYLHEVQIRLDAEKKDLLSIIEGDSTAKEISNAKKELKSLDKKIDELKAYDELLHHMADMHIEIDLDDGLKVNYEKFKGLVAKI